ncbi:polyprenyl synthetase, putative, partial [Bodo saltans]
MLPRQESSRLVAPPPIGQLLADDIMAPFRHVAALESKQFRGALVDAFDEWLHLPPSAAGEVKAVVEMLHNASLIVDDIEDSSNLRRGARAAHRVYGMPLALNAANTAYFVALSRLMGASSVVTTELETTTQSSREDDDAQRPKLHSWTDWVRRLDFSFDVIAENHFSFDVIAEHYHHAASSGTSATSSSLTLKLCEIFSHEMIELHHGQGLDIYWRDMVQCPTLEEYDEMVLKKTGGLFRLAIRFMIALSPLPACMKEGEEDASDSKADHVRKVGELFAALIPLVNDIGVFFQTLDDYLNVCNEDYHKNKSYCEDLTEGKFSYPVIHCLHHQATRGDKTLMHILRQRPTDHEVKRYCVDMMRQAGSLEACKQR